MKGTRRTNQFPSGLLHFLISAYWAPQQLVDLIIIKPCKHLQKYNLYPTLTFHTRPTLCKKSARAVFNYFFTLSPWAQTALILLQYRTFGHPLTEYLLCQSGTDAQPWLIICHNQYFLEQWSEIGTFPTAPDYLLNTSVPLHSSYITELWV